MANWKLLKTITAKNGQNLCDVIKDHIQAVEKISFNDGTLTGFGIWNTNVAIRRNGCLMDVSPSPHVSDKDYLYKWFPISLRKIKLMYFRFFVSSFYNVDFSESCFGGTTFMNCTFLGCNFKNSDLDGVHFIACRFFNCKFDDRTKINRTKFSKVYFDSTDLRQLDFRWADIHEFCVSDTCDINYNQLPLSCPAEGSFIAYKKVKNANLDVSDRRTISNQYSYIAVLEIPADAKRSSAGNNKCRADKAKVIRFETLDGRVVDTKIKCCSCFNKSFYYELGKMVTAENFDENRYNECAPGIHFFVSRVDAVNYLN